MKDQKMDLWSRARGFDSRSGCYQVVTGYYVDDDDDDDERMNFNVA